MQRSGNQRLETDTRNKITALHLLLVGDVGGIETLCRNIGRASTNRNIFCFVRTGGVIADEMRQDGIEVHILNRSSWKMYLQCSSDVERLCKQYHVDLLVIHHEAPCIWIAAMLIHRKLKIPYIVYAHCNYQDIVRSNHKKSYVKEQLYRKLLRYASAIIGISKSVVSSIKRAVPETEAKIRLVYNGIPLQEYQTNVLTVRRLAPHIELIYVGRMIPEKGVDSLLDAFADLYKKINRIHLTLVGTGSQMEALKRRSRSLQISEAVLFTGQQMNVASWLKQADIFVHPAAWEEGFGLTIVEAMSAGAITVAVRHGAAEELIEDGVSGFLVDSDNLTKGIWRAIQILGTEQEVIMRENAVRQAGRFSIETTVAQLERVFQEVLDNESTY